MFNFLKIKKDTPTKTKAKTKKEKIVLPKEIIRKLKAIKIEVKKLKKRSKSDRELEELDAIADEAYSRLCDIF